MIETHDPKVRWNVIQIDHNEQNKGGEFGKRRTMNNRPLRREQAENLLGSCEDYEIRLNGFGSKNNRTYVIEKDENGV